MLKMNSKSQTFDKMTDMQKNLTESIMGSMDDKQKSKYKEMCGEKFEFPQRRRRGGGSQRSDF